MVQSSLHHMQYFFVAALEEKILNKVKEKENVWWRYIDDIFFIWEHGEKSLKEFINEINQFLDPTSCHPYYRKKGISYSQTLRLIGFAPIIIIFIKNVTSWKVGC